ncbi:MAG: polysaccharide biosynthesis/export family protein [Gemmataceae bacterium]|nr:polysaccharide biosynthesis/export family protein [Gemmataceae bacterium]
MRGGRRWAGVAALGLAAAAVGCVHTDPGMVGPVPHGAAHAAAPIAVPPPGAVPRELDKVALPPYVIEAPDNLLIEVMRIGKAKQTDRNGNEIPNAPEVDALLPLELQPVSSAAGGFLVRPDGQVNLGMYGTVMVAGLTLEQAAEAIRQHVARSPALARLGKSIAPDSLVVIVDVLAYNSKLYYVVLDGGGYGEQVYKFYVQGSETVMDAIANVNGLQAVASKRNIWVARRCPNEGHPWQILPVDWIGITQHGYTTTNYQVMPGDRIYVKAQRLVTIDTALARVLSPVERIFGITLLGANTVNQINGRGFGFNNNP